MVPCSCVASRRGSQTPDSHRPPEGNQVSTASADYRNRCVTHSDPGELVELAVMDWVKSSTARRCEDGCGWIGPQPLGPGRGRRGGRRSIGIGAQVLPGGAGARQVGPPSVAHHHKPLVKMAPNTGMYTRPHLLTVAILTKLDFRLLSDLRPACADFSPTQLTSNPTTQPTRPAKTDSALSIPSMCDVCPHQPLMPRPRCVSISLTALAGHLRPSAGTGLNDLPRARRLTRGCL